MGISIVISVMHTKLNRNRLAGTAIAAVLAIIATPALGQETDPLAPMTEETAAPVETTIPPAETSTADEPARASDSIAPEAEEAAPAAAATTAAATSERRAATRRTAQAAPRTVTAPSAAPAPVAEVAAPLAATDPAPIAPPIAAEAEPMPVEQPAQELALDDDALPIAAGAGLGLLLLGGAAAGLRRRHRKAVAYRDVRQPVAEPAFARTAAREPATHRPAPSPAREMAPAPFVAAPAVSTAGLSHTERAKRGPTPENPFLSLKKRLKRAAFFEQRDRAVAAGKARPVNPTAGLPERMVKAMAPRPAPFANSSHPTIRYGGFSYQPA